MSQRYKLCPPVSVGSPLPDNDDSVDNDDNNGDDDYDNDGSIDNDDSVDNDDNNGEDDYDSASNDESVDNDDDVDGDDDDKELCDQMSPRCKLFCQLLVVVIIAFLPVVIKNSYIIATIPLYHDDDYAASS